MFVFWFTTMFLPFAQLALQSELRCPSSIAAEMRFRKEKCTSLSRIWMSEGRSGKGSGRWLSRVEVRSHPEWCDWPRKSQMLLRPSMSDLPSNSDCGPLLCLFSVRLDYYTHPHRTPYRKWIIIPCFSVFRKWKADLWRNVWKEKKNQEKTLRT